MGGKYLITCNNKPEVSLLIKEWTVDAANGLREYSRPTHIYIAE